MPKKIVRVELLNEHCRIHCPFCGLCIFRVSDDQAKIVEPGDQVCPHTLFVASDYGFDFSSERFKSDVRLKEDDVVEDIDKFTNKCSIYGAIKFAFYANEVGADNLAMYAGFAPNPDATEGEGEGEQED